MIELARAAHVVAHLVVAALTALLIAFAILQTMWAGSEALLYAGLALIILGELLLAVGHAQLRKCGEVRRRPLSTETSKLVDSGVYALIRHPIYEGYILFATGLALVSQHPLALVSAALVSLLTYLEMVKEERKNFEKFGEAYRRYMDSVPRANLALGLYRLLNRRKAGIER